MHTHTHTHTPFIPDLCKTSLTLDIYFTHKKIFLAAKISTIVFLRAPCTMYMNVSTGDKATVLQCVVRVNAS